MYDVEKTHSATVAPNSKILYGDVTTWDGEVHLWTKSLHQSVVYYKQTNKRSYRKISKSRDLGNQDASHSTENRSCFFPYQCFLALQGGGWVPPDLHFYRAVISVLLRHELIHQVGKLSPNGPQIVMLKGVWTVDDSLWEHSGHVVLVLPFLILTLYLSLSALSHDVEKKGTLDGSMDSCPYGGWFPSLVPGSFATLGTCNLNTNHQSHKLRSTFMESSPNQGIFITTRSEWVINFSKWKIMQLSNLVNDAELCLPHPMKHKRIGPLFQWTIKACNCYC